MNYKISNQKVFRQKEDVDYFDTYALVASTMKIKVSFASDSLHDLIVYQKNVKMTFQNEYLDEEIFMEKSKGHVLLGNADKTCKLSKSLDGLK